MDNEHKLERQLRLIRKDIDQLFKLCTSTEVQEMRTRGAGPFQIDETDPPKPLVDSPRQWEPMPRQFHQEVLDKLMQRIQETSGLQTTERNAVELLDGILEDAKKKELPDGIHAALKAAEYLKSKLDGVEEELRHFHFETMEERIDLVKETLDNHVISLTQLQGLVDGSWATLRLIDDLPACIESLEETLSGLKTRTDQASVVAAIKVDFSAEKWGIDHPGLDQGQKEDFAEKLNFALGQACEVALLETLKRGTGFGTRCRDSVDRGLTTFFRPLIDNWSSWFSNSNWPWAEARLFAYDYFGVSGYSVDKRPPKEVK